MSRFALRPIIAGLSLTIAAGALSGTALAAAATDATTAAPAATAPHGGPIGKGPHAGPGEHRRWEGMRDSLWIPGVGPIGKKEVDQLKLNTQQQGLFKTAQDAQRDFGKSMHDAGRSRHKLLDDQVAGGKIDPRALMDQESQNRKQFEGQADQVKQKWLAVWDSLSDGQRGQVTQFVKQRQARWDAERAEHKGEHHGKPGPDGHRPPPPAGAPAPADKPAG
jgi:periplasmic protein CpxP/Spy